MATGAARFTGSRRFGAAAVVLALLGSLVAPSVALAAGPRVSISLAAGQANPTNKSPILFVVTFSDPVTGFTSQDIEILGSLGYPLTATITDPGDGAAFTVAITGMTNYGAVALLIPPGVAKNQAGEPNQPSSQTPNVIWIPGDLKATLNLAPGQADPTNTGPINLTVAFSDPVTGFTNVGVGVYGTAGTAGGIKVATVTGGPRVYQIAIAGMTAAETVIVYIGSGSAVNATGHTNWPSDEVAVRWWPGSPTVTIHQASGQPDPTGVSPINFAVVFSAPVTGFTSGDVTIGGTAGGTKTATVTGSGTTYNVAVSGMATAGTVSVRIAAGVAIAGGQSPNPGDPLDDGSLRPNLASTSTDNTVMWAPTTPVPTSLTLTTSAPIPPGAMLPTILWGEGFNLGVEFGPAGANKAVQLQGTRDGAVWTTITTLTTDATGHAALLYRPVTNLFYRAVFAGTPDLAAATSNEVRTVVRQLAVMRPTNSGSTRAISRNTSVIFSTTVRPSRPELAPAVVTFSFYRQVSGVWQPVTTRAVAVDSAGVARTTYQFTTAGQWYVRSQAGPTPYNANSVPTPVERYSVS